jgi:acid phosphatase (class A)
VANPTFRPKLNLIGVAIMVWCSAAAAQDTPKPKAVLGYLQRDMLPDSLRLLPAPPAADSAAFANDKAVSAKNLSVRDTPRWKLAISDADLKFPHAAGTFSCALGVPITEQDTPTLYRLLQRSLPDAGLSTYAAKDQYRRQRPFMSDDAPICTPDAHDRLMKDGSYPSGHTAIGWAWALILAEIAPEKTDAILVRGMAFGQSRVICNVHWQSDVDAGRLVGASVVARLHAEPEFRADLEMARSEVAIERSRSLPPTGDCSAEEATLRSQITP